MCHGTTGRWLIHFFGSNSRNLCGKGNLLAMIPSAILPLQWKIGAPRYFKDYPDIHILQTIHIRLHKYMLSFLIIHVFISSDNEFHFFSCQKPKNKRPWVRSSVCESQILTVNMPLLSHGSCWPDIAWLAERPLRWNQPCSFSVCQRNTTDYLRAIGATVCFEMEEAIKGNSCSQPCRW